MVSQGDRSLLTRYNGIDPMLLTQHDGRMLFELSQGFLRELFGNPPELLGGGARSDLRRDPRLLALLDLLIVVSALEADDPSHPWTRASVLSSIGAPREAAIEYLEAAQRSQKLKESGDGLADEGDWADSAVEHAATELQLANLPLATHVLSRREQIGAP
jgi:hypothetical protein